MSSKLSPAFGAVFRWSMMVLNQSIDALKARGFRGLPHPGKPGSPSKVAGGGSAPQRHRFALSRSAFSGRPQPWSRSDRAATVFSPLFLPSTLLRGYIRPNSLPTLRCPQFAKHMPTHASPVCRATPANHSTHIPTALAKCSPHVQPAH